MLPYRPRFEHICIATDKDRHHASQQSANLDIDISAHVPARDRDTVSQRGFASTNPEAPSFNSLIAYNQGKLADSEFSLSSSPYGVAGACRRGSAEAGAVIRKSRDEDEDEDEATSDCSWHAPHSRRPGARCTYAACPASSGRASWHDVICVCHAPSALPKPTSPWRSPVPVSCLPSCTLAHPTSTD
ncbi:hypothetical protein EVG20_g8949 [Dentipellis fragilis]|uniref:Uncharacterized protein n=1 Tax=Dentipellis fragilis TaxID=205917 RepID=A0A4Y9Y1P0_9AGAM|nr:hypothetical protein EVG20_g8949 [Dentipellis fragilis]